MLEDDRAEDEDEEGDGSILKAAPFRSTLLQSLSSMGDSIAAAATLTLILVGRR
jgi:hypothetical protein